MGLKLNIVVNILCVSARACVCVCGTVWLLFTSSNDILTARITCTCIRTHHPVAYGNGLIKHDHILIWFLSLFVSGLNFSDLMVRQGVIDNPPKTPFTMGFELAGEVEALGEHTSRFEVETDGLDTLVTNITDKYNN